MNPATAMLRRGLRLGAAVTLLAAALTGAAAAQAAPGAVQSVTSVAAGTQFLAVAVQSDGQIVAAGQSGGQIYVQRFTAGGAVEPGGSYTGPSGSATGVVVQSDGRIVIGGTMSGAMFAERLTSALAPDGSFGAGGIAGAFGGDSAIGHAVALGPGGTVVVAGSVGAGDTSPALARFNAAGHLDGSLAGTGGVQLNFGHFSSAQGVTVQPDGKIIIVGSQSPGLQAVNSIMARLNPDGSFDASFNGNGIRQYNPPGSANNTFTAVTVQNDNRIIVSGSDPSTGNAFFLRLNPDGSTDSGYGSSGAATLPAGFGGGAFSVAIAGQSRIVGAGSFATSKGSSDAADFMTTAAGAAAGDFGSGGVVRPNPSQQGSYKACGVAVAPDGTIVTVGDSTMPPDPYPCSPTNSAAGFVALVGGFGPPPPGPAAGTAPSVSAVAADSITSSAATLTGQINPGGLATTYHFEYGTSATALTASTPAVSVGSGTSPAPATATVTGLAPATKYYFRLVAGNAGGQTASMVLSFTTASAGGGGGGGGGGGSPAGPSAATGSATGVRNRSATLRGTVNPHGSAATFHFELGTSTNYGTSTADVSAGNGSAAAAVSATVSKLKPGTRYHYRLVATGPGGTSDGRDASFRTARSLVTLVGLPRTASLRAVRLQGLIVTLSCLRACSARGTMSVSRQVARALHLAHGALVIAVGSGSERHGGRLRIRLRLTSAAASALAKTTTLRVKVAFSVRSSHRSFTLRGSLTLTH